MTDVWAEANKRANQTREAHVGHCLPMDTQTYKASPCDTLARLDDVLASLRDALDGLADHGASPLNRECYRCHRVRCNDAARYARQRDRALTELGIDPVKTHGVTTHPDLPPAVVEQAQRVLNQRSALGLDDGHGFLGPSL